MLSTNSAFASSSEGNSSSLSFKDYVEVHTEDTSEWVILHTQVDVLLNTKSKASSIREILLLEFSILNFQTSFQDFIGFITSDTDMDSDLLVSLNAETSDGESSSWWNWLLPSKIFQDFAGWIKNFVPLVSLSPD